MSEINGPKFSVNQVSFNSTQKPQNDVPQIASENETPQINDLIDPKAVIGRSMIKESDNVNGDLKALLKNPQIADNSDELFETSYQAALDAGIENPYEEAATFSTGNIE